MSFPYDNIPGYRNWRTAITNVAAGAIDPHAHAKFTFDRAAKVASAGSCFAARIAEALKGYGFNYFCTEPAFPWMTEEYRVAYNYEVYSARYGNVYTTLQLLQLMERALGIFSPVEDHWVADDGSFVDPLRPSIQPGNFSSLSELHADRAGHLRAVRSLFEEVDVFVFTLGLTETWRDKRDGAVVPAAPGRGRGTFDGVIYEPYNIGVSDNVQYMERFLAHLRDLNPHARVLLTVSPVPLAATFEDEHVLQATTYSKSVLRVVAEELRRGHANVDYFASYEIVTGSFNNERYFEPDRRNVTAEAVEHVMRAFFSHFSAEPVAEPPEASARVLDTQPGMFAAKPCDEEELLRYINAEFAR